MIPDLVVCPKCKAHLKTEGEAITCTGCGAEYPVYLGVPYLTDAPLGEKDRKDLEWLSHSYDKLSYSELEDGWNRQPWRVQSEMVRRHYKVWVSQAEDFARKEIRAIFGRARQAGYEWETGVAVDIGCGRAKVPIVLSEMFDLSIGIDPNVLWLILGKKAVEERGIKNVVLVAAGGEALPLRESCVDAAVCVNTIEHILEKAEMFSETVRVLRPGGLFGGDSKNRYDMFLREPHVELRFLGLVPRRLVNSYVRWRRKVDYEGVWQVGWFQLKSMLVSSFGRGNYEAHVRVREEERRFDRLRGVWNGMMKVPGLASLLWIAAPSHNIVARKPRVTCDEAAGSQAAAGAEDADVV